VFVRGSHSISIPATFRRKSKKGKETSGAKDGHAEVGQAEGGADGGGGGGGGGGDGGEGEAVAPLAEAATKGPLLGPAGAKVSAVDFTCGKVAESCVGPSLVTRCPHPVCDGPDPPLHVYSCTACVVPTRSKLLTNPPLPTFITVYHCALRCNR
jgi:hypothetical protein